MRVVERRGKHSYVIDIQEGRRQEAHRSQLKIHQEDVEGRPLKLFRFKQAVPVEDAAPDHWEVEDIEGHRRLPNGEVEFKVRWEGSGQHTWEPLHHFFHLYSAPLVEYCKAKGVEVDVLNHLARHPAEAEAVVRAAVAAPRVTQERWALPWEEPPADWAWVENMDQKTTKVESKTAEVNPSAAEGGCPYGGPLDMRAGPVGRRRGSLRTNRHDHQHPSPATRPDMQDTEAVGVSQPGLLHAASASRAGMADVKAVGVEPGEGQGRRGLRTRVGRRRGEDHLPGTSQRRAPNAREHLSAVEPTVRQVCSNSMTRPQPRAPKPAAKAGAGDRGLGMTGRIGKSNDACPAVHTRQK